MVKSSVVNACVKRIWGDEPAFTLAAGVDTLRDAVELWQR